MTPRPHPSPSPSQTALAVALVRMHTRRENAALCGWCERSFPCAERTWAEGVLALAPEERDDDE